MYYHHASELLLKVHHKTDMSQNLCRSQPLHHGVWTYLNKLKDKVVGDIKVHIGGPWKIASAPSVLLVLDTREAGDTL